MARPALAWPRLADDCFDSSFEGFVHAVREAVEDDVRRNADNRWWVLAPTLIVQRRDGVVGFHELAPRLAERPLGRALLSADPRRILDAAGARRAAIAMHVDVELEGQSFPAIVVAVITGVASSCSYAQVERTAAGTPRLGAWLAGAPLEDELFAALGRTLIREP